MRLIRTFMQFAMISALGLALATTASAEEQAHEHGVGLINVAIESNDVEIELNVTGADTVGFEHAPSSEQDRKAVEKVISDLKNGRSLFRFPAAAKCRFESIKVTSSLGGDEHDEHDDHDDDHEHPNDAKTEDAHGGFEAHYHVHCDNPGKLTFMETLFFKKYPSAHELEARWISAGGQGAAELTPTTIRLMF